MTYEAITFEESGGMVKIGLNRPRVFNALNQKLVLELEDTISRIAENNNARGVMIFGHGDHFAAGADIAEMAGLDPKGAARFSFSPVFNSLSMIPVPVIAAIDGFALGGGLELALACDIRICTPGARFGLPEVSVGIFPGAGGTQRLPRLIGLGRASDLIFTGRIIDADTALAWGICSRMAQKDVRAEGQALLEKIAKGPGLAICGAKKAVTMGQEKGFAQGTAVESDLWADLFSSRDQKEGMRAFLNKEKPRFIGK